MFKFSKNLYTDVRIEEVFETNITFTLGKISEYKIRNYKAAFIRVFDGDRWFYSSTSDLDEIQNEIKKLSKMAKPNDKINDNPIVKKMEVNSGTFLKFKDNDISKVSEEDKLNLLKGMFPQVCENKYIKMWTARYQILNLILKDVDFLWDLLCQKEIKSLMNLTKKPPAVLRI